ncbi:hypothetical protein HZH68_017082 [Vespula germanica]|uniref:Uncharacterized protein n=1 Tax=Vespula germanica TaxID=30212 RepID=A0A834IZT0_VESGE|nr:hypothetical protein HZH68_017082 [Vespula germanica]
MIPLSPSPLMSTATRCGLTQKGDPTAGKGKGEILKVAAVPVVAVALAVAAVAVAVAVAGNAGDAGDADDADATAMWLLLTKRKLVPHKMLNQKNTFILKNAFAIVYLHSISTTCAAARVQILSSIQLNGILY